MTGMNGTRLRWVIVIFAGLPRRWEQRPLGAPIFYRLWANVPVPSKANEADVRWVGCFYLRGQEPEPVKNRRSQYRPPRGSIPASIQNPRFMLLTECHSCQALWFEQEHG
jgi:hypothetical protein